MKEIYGQPKDQVQRKTCVSTNHELSETTTVDYDGAKISSCQYQQNMDKMKQVNQVPHS